MEDFNGSEYHSHEITSAFERSPDHNDNSMHPLNSVSADLNYLIGTARVSTKQNVILLPTEEAKHIRPKTFAVLCYLCENSGRVVGKEKLIKVVWGKVCVTDDSLVQCIAEIRSALGPENKKCLRTVARMGYLLEASEERNNVFGSTLSPTIRIGPFQCPKEEAHSLFVTALCDSITVQLLRNVDLEVGIVDAQMDNYCDYQLIGSLQCYEKRIRLVARLISLPTRQTVWAQAYERCEVDIVTLQDSLSDAVAQDLVTNWNKTRCFR